ncbi:OBSCN protein, partial [Chauna torquata]|nr:OBSCN protein [Chauna torquata]
SRGDGYHGALVQRDNRACLDPWFCILAVPALFKQTLENTEMEEGKSVSLRCELTKADATVVWKKGEATLQASAKYEMKQKGTMAELVIHNAEPEDA